MNNSFARLIDGTCTTLRAEVLSRIDDEYARSQVWGVGPRACTQPRWPPPRQHC